VEFFKERKYLVWVLAIIFLLSQICIVPVFAYSTASEAKTRISSAILSDRIAGADRYKTAVAISQQGWGSSDYAVLVRGDDFADALCAGPLAQKYGGPILLTAPNQLNVDTLNELKRLGVKHLFIAGGLGAVSQNIENTLQDSGIFTIERIFGNDRYETSVKFAQKIGSTGKVVLATGTDFPDALSISSIAAKLGMPILLTAKNSLPAIVRSYFQTNTVTQTYVVGGTGAISETVANSVTFPSRLAGNDRYTTNVTIMQNFASELNFETIYVAIGTNFADALTGAVLAAKSSSPLVLTDVNMGSGTANFLQTKLKLKSNFVGLGGSSIVPSNALTSSEKSSDVEYGNTPGNINNNGLACLKGDWIYCQENLQNFASGLYRVKTDGSSQYKLSADTVNDINVIGDWVYYSCISDGIDNTDYGERIYRIKTDGTGREKLNDDRSRNVSVVGDWVYYINLNDFSYNLYRIKIDGSGRQELSDDWCNYINVVGDWIYYRNNNNGSDNWKLFRIKTDGTGRQKVSDDQFYVINVSGDWLYYRLNDTSFNLYRIKTDGSVKQKVSDDQFDEINVSGDWVYYTNNKSNNIYRIKTDGSGREKLNDDSCLDINVAGDWIYFYKRLNPMVGGGSSVGFAKLYRMKTDGSYEELLQ